MSNHQIIVLAVMAAYLLGSVPFAILSSRLFGLVDPRSYGSKILGNKHAAQWQISWLRW